jgi:hypothetical protein
MAQSKARAAQSRPVMRARKRPTKRPIESTSARNLCALLGLGEECAQCARKRPLYRAPHFVRRSPSRFRESTFRLIGKRATTISET